MRIHIAADDDEAIQKLKREADAEAKRAQNQLPTWIAQSTISGEPARPTAGKKAGDDDVKPELSELGAGGGAATAGAGADERAGSPQREEGDDLDAYYASLAEVDAPASHLDAASIALPPSAVQSPLFSPLPTPPTAKDSTSPAADGEDFGEVPLVEGGEMHGKGKRSRDDEDSGWEEGVEGGVDGKKARIGSAEQDDEDEEDDFEEVEEGDGDPNPLISIGDKQVPFAEVGDELQAAMVRSRLTSALASLADLRFPAR